MTFDAYLRMRSGQIVNVYVYGMAEHVEERGGRMTLTGRLLAYADFVTLTTVEGDVTAIPFDNIITVDWAVEDQIDVSDIMPYDFK